DQVREKGMVKYYPKNSNRPLRASQSLENLSGVTPEFLRILRLRAGMGHQYQSFNHSIPTYNPVGLHQRPFKGNLCLNAGGGKGSAQSFSNNDFIEEALALTRHGFLPRADRSRVPKQAAGYPDTQQ